MSAFLLTWKETGWPHDDIVRMARQCEQSGSVEEPWRLRSYRQAERGDRVWVLRQGRGPRGIFGAGHITGPAKLGPVNNGKMQMMAPVRFELFVDPNERLLISENAVAGVLRPEQINARASGDPLDEKQSSALEELLRATTSIEVVGGRDWTSAELQAIVADYVAMLKDELAGIPYSKTAHRTKLLEIVRRSPGSIERKHQNISAVLQELGLPWINGYKPLGNYQEALVDAVASMLSSAIEGLDQAPAAPVRPSSAPIFVEPPPPSNGSRTQAMARAVRKFDPAARDAANRKLGKAGEEYVVQLERSRLDRLGRKDLAVQVLWVAEQLGDGLGYDI